MSRPLMQNGIGQLEALFASFRLDPKILKELEHELHFRQVPRAVALLAEVQAAMHGAVPSAQPDMPPSTLQSRSIPPQQSTLWERVAVPPPVTVTSLELQPRPEMPTNAAPKASTSAKISQPPAPPIPLEDAYKLLKATSSSTWESIEQTRRQLVQLSHPGRLNSLSAERRDHTLAETKRINAAYAAISRARCA